MRVGVIGVPSSAAAHRAGQETAPAYFRECGLLDVLLAYGVQVRDHGDLPVERYRPDPIHPKAQGLETVTRVAVGVAEAVAEVARDGYVPLVLGGDCTIEIGVLAGLLQHEGTPGLVYMDGHVDLNTPQTTPSGSFDGMGMAHIIGVDGAAKELRDIAGVSPLIHPENVVLFGYNPAECDEPERRVFAGHPFVAYAVEEIRGRGHVAATEALETLQGRVDRIALHLDVDVIDYAEFPATDVPQKSPGLSFEEAMDCFATFAESPKLAAVTIAEFNPQVAGDTAMLALRLIRRVVGALAAGKS